LYIGCPNPLHMNITAIYNAPEELPVLELPLASALVPAGFPADLPGEIENTLDINELLITNQPATFFVRVIGNSMINRNINSGDLLVVDKSLTAKYGDIIVAILDGEFTVKTYKPEADKVILACSQPEIQRY
jgi:DNA polymerase V